MARGSQTRTITGHRATRSGVTQSQVAQVLAVVVITVCQGWVCLLLLLWEWSVLVTKHTTGASGRPPRRSNTVAIAPRSEGETTTPEEN